MTAGSTTPDQATNTWVCRRCDAFHSHSPLALLYFINPQPPSVCHGSTRLSTLHYSSTIHSTTLLYCHTPTSDLTQTNKTKQNDEPLPPHPRPFFKSTPHINPASLKKPSRWYLPLMAAIALGFGAYNHYTATTPATTQKYLQKQQLDQQQEEERLRKNRALMDAYGDKETLQDIERALVVYDLQ